MKTQTEKQNTPSQPKHTPGKLEIRASGEVGSMETGSLIAIIYPVSGDPEPENIIYERKANAERIVTSVNSYDNLKADNARMLEALKKLVQNFNCDSTTTLSEKIGSIVLAESAISQAEKGVSNG